MEINENLENIRCLNFPSKRSSSVNHKVLSCRYVTITESKNDVVYLKGNKIKFRLSIVDVVSQLFYHVSKFFLGGISNKTAHSNLI